MIAIKSSRTDATCQPGNYCDMIAGFGEGTTVWIEVDGVSKCFTILKYDDKGTICKDFYSGELELFTNDSLVEVDMGG